MPVEEYAAKCRAECDSRSSFNVALDSLSCLPYAYPMFNGRQTMKKINVAALLFCAIMFAIGGTASAFVAIVLSGHAVVALFSIFMSAGLLILSGLSVDLMQKQS